MCHLNSFIGAKLDNIPMRFVKYRTTVLTKPINYIVNLCIMSGIVPDQIKSTRVNPLLKISNRTDAGNYRPVSIMCFISFVFYIEKAVYNN